jgi:hypothetical protein
MSASRSTPDSIKGQPRGALSTAYRVVVLGLLMLVVAEIFLSTRREPQVFDAATHLFARWEYWKHGDFGRNPEHPPLAKLIVASALLPLHLKEPAAETKVCPLFQFAASYSRT